MAWSEPVAEARASARSGVEPFHVMEVLRAGAERQRTHGDAILLCAGQPSTPAPAAVRRAAAEAMAQQVLGYTEATGVLPLRQAIAAYHREWYAVDVDPDEVVVLTGSSGGFATVFLAAFDAGDTVVMTRPGYPAYRNILGALGCRVVEVDCGAETRFQPTVRALERLARQLGRAPHGLVVASPANPTGTIIDPAELAAIARWCEEVGCLLISDEIYHGISYGRPTASAWQTSRSAVVVGSVSKYFSMTGWRLGWTLVPPYLRRPMEVLTQNLSICPPAISQYAAVAAFGAEARAELEGHVRRYGVNREVLLRRLPGLGLGSFAPPDGAFYAWCDISHLSDDSLTWCRQVLAATGVALTPGVDFDTARGSSMMRLSFAGATEALEEALDRLARCPLLRAR